MRNPDQLSTFIRTLGKCTVALPACRAFPTVVIIALRDNSAGRPQGVEANFLQFVTTAVEQFPSGAPGWPQGPLEADAINYGGHRIVVRRGGQECRMYVDRGCPITLHSVDVLPGDFEHLLDPELLEQYLRERPHSSSSLSDEVYVAQMGIARERAATAPQHAHHRMEKPLYDRPSVLKTLAWLAVGVAAIILGIKIVAASAYRGIGIDFVGWSAVVAGAAVIVRRGLDLVFPPSRL